MFIEHTPQWFYDKKLLVKSTTISFSVLNAEMEDFLESLFVTLKAILLLILSTIRNLFPTGFLPRKDVRGEWKSDFIANSGWKLIGQTVLITGSGSGLGRLMSYEFGKLGARIVLWDINEGGNLETLKELESRGVEVSGLNVSHLFNIPLKLYKTWTRSTIAGGMTNCILVLLLYSLEGGNTREWNWAGECLNGLTVRRAKRGRGNRGEWNKRKWLK